MDAIETERSQLAEVGHVIHNNPDRQSEEKTSFIQGDGKENNFQLIQETCADLNAQSTSTSLTKELIVERIIRYMGNNGRYQKMIFIQANILMFGVGFVLVCMSYLAPLPITQCPKGNNGEFEICPESEACDLRSKGLPNKIEFAIESLTTRYDLVCDKANLRDLGKTLFLIITTIGTSVWLFLLDILGRKRILCICSFIVVSGMLLTIFVPVYLLQMISIGLVNTCSSLFSTTISMMINENTTPEVGLRSKTVAASFGAFAFGVIVLHALAYISTKPEFLLGIVLAVLGTSSIIFCLSVEESPLFFLNNSKVEKFFDLVEHIKVSRNKLPSTPEDNQTLLTLKSDLAEALRTKKQHNNSATSKPTSTNSHSSQLRSLFCNGRNVYTLTALCFIGGYVYSVFYGMSINIQDLGLKDTKLNGILFGITQGIGYLGMLPFSNNMRRKRWHIIFQLIMMTGAVILLILSLGGSSKRILIAQTAVAIIFCGTTFSALFTIFFLYVTELFPVELRGTASSIVLLVSNILSTVTPILAVASAKYKVHFLVGCSVVGIISIPLTFGLRETIKARTSINPPTSQ